MNSIIMNGHVMIKCFCLAAGVFIVWWLSFYPMQVGDRVVVAGSRMGMVRFTGAVKFAPG